MVSFDGMIEEVCCPGSMLDTFDEAWQMMSWAALLELRLKRCWSLVQFRWYVGLHLYVLFSCVVCKYLSGLLHV